MQNRRIVLASRPDGVAGLQNFRLESVPAPEPGPGQLLLRTRWLSLDPSPSTGRLEVRWNCFCEIRLAIWRWTCSDLSWVPAFAGMRGGGAEIQRITPLIPAKAGTQDK